MLRAEPVSWGSWSYRVLRGESCLARFDIGWFRERGEIVIDHVVHDVRRDGLVSGPFVMRRGRETIVSAIKPSMFERRFEIDCSGSDYAFTSASSFNRKFVLREHGREIGAVRPVHFLSRKAIVDLPPEMPLDVQVFLTWIAIAMWKRQSEGS